MVNHILNVTATGVFQELPNIPQRCVGISMQARTAVDMQYHFRGQTTFWTIKANDVRSMIGLFQPGDLYIQAVAGVIVEVEYTTDGISA